MNSNEKWLLSKLKKIVAQFDVAQDEWEEGKHKRAENGQFGNGGGGGSVKSEKIKSDFGEIDIEKGTVGGSELISSQDYMDNDIVNEKIKNKDFDVQVSPEFDIDGKKYRVITDGHHSLAAALKSRNTPNFKEQTEQDNDRIALLNNGDIEGFLESTHQGDDYRNRINNNLVF